MGLFSIKCILYFIVQFCMFYIKSGLGWLCNQPSNSPSQLEAKISASVFSYNCKSDFLFCFLSRQSNNHLINILGGGMCFRETNQVLHSPSSSWWIVTARPWFIFHLVSFTFLPLTADQYFAFISVSRFFLSFSQFNMDRTNTEEFLEVYKGVVTEYTVSKADLMPFF